MKTIINRIKAHHTRRRYEKSIKNFDRALAKLNRAAGLYEQKL